MRTRYANASSVLARIALAAACLAVPVRAQPVYTQVTQLADGDASADFGIAVDVDGDRAAVGAYLDEGQGAVYVYERTGGAWTRTARLVGSTTAAGDAFGNAVAVSGDVIVVGAPLDDDGGSNSGAAFVFERDPATGDWSEVLRTAPTLVDDQDRLGFSVEADGDLVVLGAYLDEGGKAFVYRRTGGVWALDAALLRDDPAEQDGFGYAVSVSGERAIVGSLSDDDAGSASGSAYVFEPDGSGGWAQVAKLTASDASSGSLFGAGVALDGDRALVGAEIEDEQGSESGAAYVYDRDASGDWLETAKLLPSDGDASDRFGRGVSLDGDRALVGAFGVRSGRGAAYVFALDGGVWAEQAILLADPASGSNDFFGLDVALSGTTAFVGAYGVDAPTTNGAAYVFEEQPPTAGEADAEAGFSVTVAPNPTAGAARLTVALDQPSAFRVALYDVRGRRVAVLHDGSAVGELSLPLDTARLTPGVYVIHVAGASFAATRRLVVTR